MDNYDKAKTFALDWLPDTRNEWWAMDPTSLQEAVYDHMGQPKDEFGRWPDYIYEAVEEAYTEWLEALE